MTALAKFKGALPLLLCLCLGFILLGPGLARTGPPEEKAPAPAGPTAGHRGDLYLIYEAALVYPRVEGEFTPLVPPGTALEAGEVIGVQSSGSLWEPREEAIAAPARGILSYDLDAADGVVTPENLLTLDLLKVQGLLSGAAPAREEGLDRPLAKVIDVNKAPLALLCPEAGEEDPEEGRIALIAADGTRLTGEVLAQAPGILVLELSPVPQEFLLDRRHQVRLQTAPKG